MKQKPLLLAITLCIVHCALCIPAFAELRPLFDLPPLFSDNMVIQAGQRTPIWGTTRPNSRIIARLVRDRDSRTLAYNSGMSDNSGNFKILLSSLSHNVTPCTLTLETLNGESHSIQNVVVGEVWLCAGEANMKWPLIASETGESDNAAADFPALRFFTVSGDASTQGDGTGVWVVCTPQTARDFSAVGFHFGRDLQQSFKRPTPVGVIAAAAPIAPLQAWLSPGALAQSNLINIVAAASLPPTKNDDGGRDASATLTNTLDFPVTAENIKWAQPSTSIADWSAMNLPIPLGWDGISGMDNFQGAVWFRKTMEIPADWIEKTLTLRLGVISETDIAYFNGQQIGATGTDIPNHGQLQRIYTIPSRLVRATENVIALRVSDHRGGGGVLTGPLQLAPADNSGAPLSLIGSWAYRVEYLSLRPSQVPLPLGLSGFTMDNPSSIFNSMIDPLIPYAISGILWYQGESDTGNIERYRKLFPELIHDWRFAWKIPNLPFYWAQLPNFGQPKVDPEDTEWARFRHMQSDALSLYNTGQIVLIDSGDMADIHPRNKTVVGQRFALLARAKVYGQNVVTSGPTFRRVRLRDKKLVITFRDYDRGLELRGGHARSFAVAGADGVFHWADTVEIDGRSTVIVGSSKVAQPVFVRYAWGNNPTAPLYNTAGLPASPFEAKVE